MRVIALGIVLVLTCVSGAAAQMPIVTPQQPKVKECGAKWEQYKTANSVDGKEVYEAFLSGCLQGSVLNAPANAGRMNAQPTAGAPKSNASPFKNGLYVRKGTSCVDPPNAMLLHFNGRAFTGGHGYLCSFPADKGSGPSYKCLVASGSDDAGKQHTYLLKNQNELTLVNSYGTFEFRWCNASLS